MSSTPAGLRRPSIRLAAAFLVVVAAIVVPMAWLATRHDAPGGPAGEVTCGIVIAIDQSSLTDVGGFTLRLTDGTTVSYRIDVARLAPDSFVPGHLREHLELVSPVCVTHASGNPLALDLRDAPP
jgi:hypothetical protein